ncbi:MAG: preprotein translocase subunit SecA, partial [Patescibacteria group bacterium]
MALFGLFKTTSRHEKAATTYTGTVEAINKLAPEMKALSDEALAARVTQHKGKSWEDLQTHVAEIFAAVREASDRTLKLRHFDVQLTGGLALLEGRIAEMKTGEGKTLVATLPLTFAALAGRGAHLVTVNDYLARRDAEWMAPIYRFFGLSVGIVVPGQSSEEKRAAYAADVTYGTNNEYGFDYLRDNMAQRREDLTQRELTYAIVDEVDSILIDEARTPLIISAPDAESTQLYVQFARLVPQLKENVHYNLDEKRKAATLTDDGVNEVERILGMSNIYEEKGVRYVHHLEQALRAHSLYHRDKDYVVQDGQVKIVDEFTGRILEGRRYSEGLHQALEAKEGVAVQQESRTLATITFQNYFRLYQRLAGMTGTAVTSAEEFERVYNLEVVVVPTDKAMVRNDRTDRVFVNENAKFQAVVKEIRERHAKGQPVLVGTIAIEKSERLSAYLQREGVPHEVLNAKHHAREAEIVAKAGQKGTVTISTNMAGRGTDIKLGQGVVDLGGLFILGTERHEARRIDNQLRGRSGRQGDPGETQFFVSLDDDVMRIFGGDRIKNLMQRLKLPEDEPIENRMVSRAIESAQERVEGYYFDMRKLVLS